MRNGEIHQGLVEPGGYVLRAGEREFSVSLGRFTDRFTACPCLRPAFANLATEGDSTPTQAYIDTTFSAHTTCHGVNLYTASRAFRYHHWIRNW